MPPSSRGPGHLLFTEETGIRIPLGVKNILIKTKTIFLIFIYIKTIKNDRSYLYKAIPKRTAKIPLINAINKAIKI